MDTIGIELNQIEKRFEQIVAINSLSLTLQAGGIIGLVGPDGAGKTTLMRMMAGLLTPTSGTIRVAGFEPTEQRESLRKILGYMPQKFGLYEDLTVMENLRLFAELKNIQGQQRDVMFDQLLAFTDLARFTDRLAGKLSGGMKQKLGLACALLGEPKVLLLDEPGVGVDPISRRELWKMVHALAKEGMLIIWSTAYLDEAEQCQEIVLLNEGQLLFNGVPTELTKRVSGRVVFLSSTAISHRKLLQDALKLPIVSDGVIQGDSIRLIVKPDVAIDTLQSQLTDHHDIQIKPAEGRFEDAFIDLLGGMTVKESVLTNIMPTITAKPDQVVIEAKELTKQFGTFIATDHVNFQVKRGEIFGLLGPNGAGKSTTFKMMCGLLKISAGKALVLNLDLAKSPTQIRQHIGYMAQKFSLYDKLTIVQNLQFFSGVYGLFGKQQKNSIDEMIEAFNFHTIINQKVDNLSLGFKQRLALACALMHKPDILFLDEPTSGVDPITRREFWIHINSLVDKGVTVMVTTHFMDEAEYCDRIGLVFQGKIIAMGSPDQLKQQVVSPEVSSPTMEEAFIALILRYKGNA